jgi:uncharacterized protein YbaA (DUF1428 family)
MSAFGRNLPFDLFNIGRSECPLSSKTDVQGSSWNHRPTICWGMNVIAVPTANKQKYIDHARLSDSVFTDLGATRVTECWADDVPDGKVTDFAKSVQATADETVVFSWIEWPDKETRDAAMKTMMSDEFNDERMNTKKNPMPFNGNRLIYGGFEPIVEI